MTTSNKPLVVTSTFTSNSNFNTYFLDATSGNFTFTLQNASQNGITITLNRVDTSSNVVTISGSGNINGNSSVQLRINEQVTLTSLGGNWYGAIFSNGNVTSGSTLTSDAIIKGNGTGNVQPSEISITSSNDLIIKKTRSTDMYTGSGTVFTYDTFYSEPELNMGTRFSISSPITITAFKAYENLWLSPFRLWNSAGTQIASAPLTNITSGWMTSDPLDTGPLTISPGTYTLSLALEILPGINSATFSFGFRAYPFVLNGITQLAMYTTNSSVSFPNTLSDFPNCIGLDMVWNVVNYSTITTNPSTNNILTLPDKSSTLALSSQTTNIVTSSQTGVGGNVIVGGGSREIQFTSVPKTSLITSGSNGYKIDYFSITAAGTGFAASTTSFTSASWSPTGTLTVTVSSGYYTQVPTVLAQISEGSSNPLTKYSIFQSSLTSTTSLVIMICQGATAINKDVIVTVVGK